MHCCVEVESLTLIFMQTLFELAPNLRAVFGKPKQILSVKFVEMMSTLVSFHGKLQDGVYNEQLVCTPPHAPSDLTPLQPCFPSIPPALRGVSL